MASSNKSAGKKPAASAREAKTDATALLQRDHDEVRGLFKEYDKLADDEADSDERQALAEQICTMLTAHATIEEEIFYPAAREAEVESDLLDEAEVEHAAAKDLIAQIQVDVARRRALRREDPGPRRVCRASRPGGGGRDVPALPARQDGPRRPRRGVGGAQGGVDGGNPRLATFASRAGAGPSIGHAFRVGESNFTQSASQRCGRLAAAPKSMHAQGPTHLQSSLVEGPPGLGRCRPDPGQRRDDAGLRAARSGAQHRAAGSRLAGGRRAPAGGDGLGAARRAATRAAQRRAAAAGGDACRRPKVTSS